MPRSIRALVAVAAGEPADVLRLESRPVPTPDAGQAVIRVKATPVHASDLHVLRGRYGFSPEFPAVGGYMECVGRIADLAPQTEGLKVGERVVAAVIPAVPGPPVTGTWQEYLVADSHRLLPVPLAGLYIRAISTGPSPVLAWARVGPLSTVRAAFSASSGSDLPRRRRSARSNRFTSKTATPWASR
ncbi:alcohol dehydrogenase catalytic domain-containing protein [Streptomyces sp. NPDC001848]|uniref:alcohol dehydrogenase catalytic domain-containing protein n=1 Tax=Streptomyces sp. NPDC001848 TaxID=3364618 RepID=UPI0036B82656